MNSGARPPGRGGALLWLGGPNLVAMADARHAAVMAELATIKRMLRQCYMANLHPHEWAGRR